MGHKGYQELLEAAAEALERGDAGDAVAILARVSLDVCGVGQLGKTARVAKRAGALELWAAAGQSCVRRFPEAVDGYLALLSDLDILAEPAAQETALETAELAVAALEQQVLSSAAVAFHANRVIQRFSGDRDLKDRSQHIANDVFAAAEDGGSWAARDQTHREDLARKLLETAAEAVESGDTKAAAALLGRVSLDACGVGQLTKTARIAKRAGALELWATAGQSCVRRFPEAVEGYLALLSDLDILAEPAAQQVALETAHSAINALEDRVVSSAAVAFHANRVIQRFSGDPTAQHHAQQVADRVYATAEDGAQWQARDQTLREDLARRLLETAAEAVDRDDPAGAVALLGRVSLDACGVGQLGKTARVAKRAGDLELWAAAGQSCVRRFPEAVEGYLALLSDLDILLAEPTAQQTALDTAHAAIAALEGEDLTAAPVAFHANRVIQRFSTDPDTQHHAQQVADRVYATAEDGAQWQARDQTHREDLARKLLETAAEAVEGGDTKAAVALLGRVSLDACGVGQLGKAARVAKRAGALELWAAAGQSCVRRFPEAADGYLALLSDLDILLAEPTAQQTALDTAHAAIDALEEHVVSSAAPVAFHANRVIQRFSTDPAAQHHAQQVADRVYATAEDGAQWQARDQTLRGNLARKLLETAAETLSRGDPDAAIEILAQVPLDACGAGHLGQLARVAKRAGDLDMWASAARLCVTRFPTSPDGYLTLLDDLDVLLADPGLQGMAIEAAQSALEALQSEDLTAAPVAFHANRVIQRFSGDRDLKVRSQHIANGVFVAADDGAIWQARDLLRLGALEQAADVLAAADLNGRRSDESVLVRGQIALAAGRWGRDWVHLKALEKLTSPSARKYLEGVNHVRGLFAALGEDFDAGPTTPSFMGIASPESAAEVICRRPQRQPTDQAHGLLIGGGSLAAGGAERLMAICFREFRRREVLGGVDLALPELQPRSGHDNPFFFLPLTGASASDLVYLRDPGPAVQPFSYLPVGMARRTQAWYQLFSERPPQVVHAWLDYTMLCAGLAAVWAGVPKIILHSLNMRPQAVSDERERPSGQRIDRTRGWKEVYAQLFSRGDVHFVNCSQVATQDYLDWIELHETEVNAHTIHNGIDLIPFEEDGTAAAAELRASLGIPYDAPVVGTAFRFTPVKQPDHWVEAAIRIRRAVPDAHFVMFGDGADRAPLTQQIEAEGVSHFIHCPGRFDDIHLRLQLLDVFMLSSRSEGLPNVLIEAQACGVPVVAYDVGGVREALVEGVTGELVRETNPDALAAAVVSVLQNRQWRLSAGNEGRLFVRREFSIDKMADKLDALIND